MWVNHLILPLAITAPMVKKVSTFTIFITAWKEDQEKIVLVLLINVIFGMLRLTELKYNVQTQVPQISKSWETTFSTIQGLQ